jgi:cytochrome c
MTKFSLIAGLALAALAAPAFAGDAAKGESEFKKCKACHAIIADDGTEIMKGGKTGPNLYGVIGRQIGTAADFKYGESIVAAKTKMTFKLAKGGEDVAAYLASVKPAQ